MSIRQIDGASLVPRDSTLSARPRADNLISEIALKIFKESAASLVFGSVVAVFVRTQMGLALLISAAFIQLAVSAFFHALQVFAEYKALHRDALEPCYRNTQSFCGWAAGMNFALFTGFNTQTLIHESGHFLASLATYKNPRPMIEVHPFVGGMTQFYKTGLSRLGQRLGPAATTCFVVASGPAFALLISSAVLAIGIAILENYPDLGKYLISWASIDFLNHAFYAYSALSAEQWNLAHDFVHLSIFGLSPIAATIGIIAVYTLVSLGTVFYTTREQPRNVQAPLLAY